MSNSRSMGGMDIHMTKGNEDDSYSKNSEVQRRVIEKVVVPNLDDALAHFSLPANDGPIVLADLGCSSGPNTILIVSQIVEKIRASLQSKEKSSLEFQAFFNDLPSTDFNNLFQLLSSNDVQGSKFFSAGVPGSFFGPLFPQSTVHVFVCSNALHFLSKVPASVYDKDSAAFNKGTWWAFGCGSSCGLNKEAAIAFRNQNDKDIDTFLKIRAKELVPGGLLCCAICTRWNPDSTSVETSFETHVRCVDNALKELTKKGIVSEDCADFFNIPAYLQTTAELQKLILKHDSIFEVLACKEIRFKPIGCDNSGQNPESSNSQVVQTAMSMHMGALSDVVRRQLGEEAARLFPECLEKELSANVAGLSGESPFVFVALKKKATIEG